MRRATLLLLPILLLAGCAGGDVPGMPGEGAAGPSGGAGTASGTVTTEAGAPVEGAAITIQGTTYGGGDAVAMETRTDAQGRYAVRVPDGRYAVQGMIEVEYDGQTFLFRLAPEDGRADQQDAATGVVEDLVWRTTGFRGGTLDRDDPTSYHGTYVEALSPFWYSMETRAPEHEEPPEGSTTTFTFVAKEPAVDGTIPEPFSHSVTWPVWGPEARYAKDVKVGVYEVNGTIEMPDGTVFPLTLASEVHGSGEASRFSDPGATVEVRFLAHEAPLIGATEAAVYIVGW